MDTTRRAGSVNLCQISPPTEPPHIGLPAPAPGIAFRGFLREFGRVPCACRIVSPKNDLPDGTQRPACYLLRFVTGLAKARNLPETVFPQGNSFYPFPVLSC